MELLYILTAPIFMLQAVCKYWISRSYDVYILMQHRHDLQVFYHGLLIIFTINNNILLRYPGSTKFYSTFKVPTINSTAVGT